MADEVVIITEPLLMSGTGPNWKRRDDGSDPLCCCEYVNFEGERSHILATCCECYAIDDTCDRWIKGLDIPDSNFAMIRATIVDRMRLPWLGGARKCVFDSWAPPTFLAFLFLFSNVSIWLSFALTPIILLVSRQIVRSRTRSQFYYMWTVSSFVGLLAVFEYSVVPLLLISWYEHTVFASLLAIVVVCWYRVRVHQGLCEPAAVERDVCADSDDRQPFCPHCQAPRPPRACHCPVCDRCVHLRDHHCVWLDRCVGGANQRAFVAGLAAVSGALLWAAYLTLTSVCYCRTLVGTWQLPVSCNVRSNGHPVAVFAAGYAIVSAALCCCLLCHQCYLVSRGLTGSEHRRRLPPPAQTGVCGNWRRFLSGRRPHEPLVGQRSSP